MSLLRRSLAQFAPHASDMRFCKGRGTMWASSPTEAYLAVRRGGALPSVHPPAGKIFCPVSFVYRPIFFRQSHQHRLGSIRKNLCVCLIFPGMTNFPLAEKNFLCYAPFIIRKGSCGYDQRNVRLPHACHFCAGPMRRFLLRGYARHSGHYYSGRQPAAGVRFCIAFLRDPDGAFPSFFAGVLTRPPIAEARGLAHPAGPLYL